MSYSRHSEKKYEQPPRPPTGVKPRGFRPVKKVEENLADKILGEAESKDSE